MSASGSHTHAGSESARLGSGSLVEKRKSTYQEIIAPSAKKPRGHESCKEAETCSPLPQNASGHVVGDMESPCSVADAVGYHGFTEYDQMNASSEHGGVDSETDGLSLAVTPEAVYDVLESGEEDGAPWDFEIGTGDIQNLDDGNCGLQDCGEWDMNLYEMLDSNAD